MAWVKGRYDKYIDLEFSYLTEDCDSITLNYNGYDNQLGGMECSKCGKKLKTGHSFTATNQNEEEWFFGSECVRDVFGAGIVK